MISPSEKTPEPFPWHILVRLGSAIGAIMVTMTLLDLILPFSKNISSSNGVPYGTLAFWGIWILVFVALEKFWVPKPSVPPISPEIKKQHTTYLIVILLLGIIDLVIMMVVMQKWNSGSEDGILVLILLWFVIATISMIVVTRYFIFIMDMREKNRKGTVAENSLMPGDKPVPEEKNR
jgi:hypothetical protein